MGWPPARRRSRFYATQNSFPAAAPAPDSPCPRCQPPGLVELFMAFAKMSLAGFGGVLVWARRGIVDEHRWMTHDAD